nr:AraC family transcriptional regulator [uncultured Halomonas sp.]
MNRQALDISNNGYPVPRYPSMEREIDAGHTRFMLLPPGEVSAILFAEVCVIDVNLNPVTHLWAWNSDRLQKSRIAANSLAFAPPGGEFRIKAANFLPGLVVELEPNYWAQVLEREFNLNLEALDFLDYLKDPVVADLGRAGINLLMKDFRSGERAESLALEAISLALIARIARRFQNDRHITMAEKITPGTLSPRHLARVLDYIEAHLDDSLSLAALAGTACLSTSHFGRAFKLATGTSPLRYVVQRRVERAKLMLPHSERSIAQVAYDCGFAGQSHFTRTFHDITGVTPAVFRKQTKVLQSYSAA